MEEQTRLVAGELHDGAMQELTLARLQVDLLRARVGDDPALAEQFARLSLVLDEASSQLRELMRSLTPGPFDIVQASS